MSVKPVRNSILVTGGAGFIGSHLVERLTAGGADVVVIDNLSTGRIENLSQVPVQRLQVIRAPVTEALGELEHTRFDAVYHLAACVGVDLVLEKPDEVIQSSLRAATMLLDLSARWNCPTLLASSSEVYGKSPAVPFREDADVVYGPTTVTRWSYAYAKGMDEFLALSYASQHNHPVVIVRLFNTIGPRQVGDYGMVLPRFVEAALANRPLRIFGDGRQVRCFCDVRDVVRAMEALVQSNRSDHHVFNVGSDEAISINDLAKLVIRVVGSSSDLEHVGYAQAYGVGFEDVPSRIPDLNRIRAAIGFEPTISLEQSIRDIASQLQCAAAPAGAHADGRARGGA